MGKLYGQALRASSYGQSKDERIMITGVLDFLNQKSLISILKSMSPFSSGLSNLIL